LTWRQVENYKNVCLPKVYDLLIHWRVGLLKARISSSVMGLKSDRHSHTPSVQTCSLLKRQPSPQTSPKRPVREIRQFLSSDEGTYPFSHTHSFVDGSHSVYRPPHTVRHTSFKKTAVFNQEQKSHVNLLNATFYCHVEAAHV